MFLTSSKAYNILNSQDVTNFNILANFCGPRDIPTLTSQALQEKYSLPQADIFVLFGGSILYGVDILAKAINNHIAKNYVIVGGFGHTTATLQNTVSNKYPDIPATEMQEAEIFAALLKKRFNLSVDFLETKSTNCGNNITYLLNLIHRENIPCKSIILAQDATMQRRMSACLTKYVNDSIQIINYAVYQNELIFRKNKLQFLKKIPGMWSVERYQKLLMGELPRLTDDKSGYGPQGKNFISHVDIPQKVAQAYRDLQTKYPEISRPSNDHYSS